MDNCHQDPKFQKIVATYENQMRTYEADIRQHISVNDNKINIDIDRIIV